MLKILHISDLHLNAIFNRKRETVRETLKLELLSSFERSIQYAVQNQMDAFLIVGDLLDHSRLSFKLERQIKNAFSKLLDEKIHVFYITGNHDPLDTLPWIGSMQESPFFHLLGKADVQKLNLTSRGGTSFTFVASGHENRGEKRNLVASYPPKSTSEVWIGAAHASVDQYQANDLYMPTSLKDIELLGYSYFALGHIHKREVLRHNIAYSGSIQGMHILETGPKGGLKIEIQNGLTSVEPIDFSNVEWHVFDFSLDKVDCESLDKLINQLGSAIKGIIHTSKKYHLIRVQMCGRTSLYDQLKEVERRQDIESELIQTLGILDLEINVEQIAPELDIDHLKSEQTVISEFLCNIDTWERQSELKEALMKLPIFKRSLSEGDKIDYINSLLPEVQNMSVNWMVKKTDED